MPTPTLIATAGADTANSFCTAREADTYHDARLHATDWPANVAASVAIGSGSNGVVTCTVDDAGTEGNDWTIQVALGVGANIAMSAALVGMAITVTLGTNGSSTADATKNTALLIAAAITALTGVSASASGTGATVVPVTALTSFSGGTYNDDTKIPALLEAARLLETRIVWSGYTTTSTQALQWPRVGMLLRNNWTYVDYNVIPQDLKNAQAELARQLIVADLSLTPDSVVQGISSIKAGPVQVDFSGTAITRPIPDNVLDMLLPSWIVSSGRPRGMRILERA